MPGEPSGVPGEPRGNLGGTLGSTFPYDFLRDAGGTFGGMPGEPGGPGVKHPSQPSKNPFRQALLGNN